MGTEKGRETCDLELFDGQAVTAEGGENFRGPQARGVVLDIHFRHRGIQFDSFDSVDGLRRADLLQGFLIDRVFELEPHLYFGQACILMKQKV